MMIVVQNFDNTEINIDNIVKRSRVWFKGFRIYVVKTGLASLVE